MKWKKYISMPCLRRYLFVMISVFFVGLGTSITRISCMGTESFTSFNYSISEFLGVPLGTVMTSVSVVFLLLAFFFLRDGLGPGTVIVMTGLGYSADFWGMVITKAAGHEISFSGMEHYIFRLVLFLIGMMIMVFFSSFYLAADTGMSAYDTAGYMIEKYTKIPFQWARIGTDLICVGLAYGFACVQGTQWELIGPGTLIMACGVGPALNILLERAARPIVRKVCGEMTEEHLRS